MKKFGSVESMKNITAGVEVDCFAAKVTTFVISSRIITT